MADSWVKLYSDACLSHLWMYWVIYSISTCWSDWWERWTEESVSWLMMMIVKPILDLLAQNNVFTNLNELWTLDTVVVTCLSMHESGAGLYTSMTKISLQIKSCHFWKKITLRRSLWKHETEKQMFWSWKPFFTLANESNPSNVFLRNSVERRHGIVNVVKYYKQGHSVSLGCTVYTNFAFKYWSTQSLVVYPTTHQSWMMWHSNSTADSFNIL